MYDETEDVGCPHHGAGRCLGVLSGRPCSRVFLALWGSYSETEQHGEEVVMNLQADLTMNTKYDLDHDGIYGKQTFEAAKAFQTSCGLTADGQTGRNTKTRLYPLQDSRYNYE